MSQEVFLWIYLPIGLAAVAIALSVRSVMRVRSGAQIAAALFVIALSAMAAIMLVGMARGAWPTFIPHYMLAAALPVLAWQVAKTRAVA